MKKADRANLEGFLAYLQFGAEKANEDRAIHYFRQLYGHAFRRQKEADRADGFVEGHFVLELKGKTDKWLSGLAQAVAYRNNGLYFNLIVVAAQNFLAVWAIEDLPPSFVAEIGASKGPPSRVGLAIARKYSGDKKKILQTALWSSTAFDPLFTRAGNAAFDIFSSFEEVLRAGVKRRFRVTTKNFCSVLASMKEFFAPQTPIDAVRAFYTVLTTWTEFSSLQLSQRNSTQASLGGETIERILPHKRNALKQFIDTRYIDISRPGEEDEFFARYDSALDEVDPTFRINHGIFFTDLSLAKFAMWYAGKHIPELGRNYLVIDPACGSGNLVTNWKTPLQIRHKIVSEIEPELLFAVERRMSRDTWHAGKYSVVPKVDEKKGLNFLDRTASDYLTIVTSHLHREQKKVDKPIAFLCNPPFRNDDQQRNEEASYQVDNSILEAIGSEAKGEKYCCFLAQMKLICEKAEESGLPGESLMLVFTPSSWLTQRPSFAKIRGEMLGNFSEVGGFIVNSKEFFDVPGKWPVVFSIWRYHGTKAAANPRRTIPLFDLTWVKKKQLKEIEWEKIDDVEESCSRIIENKQTSLVQFGARRRLIRDWLERPQSSFQRTRRKDEKDIAVAGGLPKADRRQKNKIVYGQADGMHIGFMDDLTPVRIKKGSVNLPWFRLNSQINDFNKTRCLSGPADQKSYCAVDNDDVFKAFFWYALSRSFAFRRFPMWVNAESLWAPNIPPHLQTCVETYVFAIAYADNECVEISFPAGDPIDDTERLFLPNPLTANRTDSFWNTRLRPRINFEESQIAKHAVDVVDSIFHLWRERIKGQPHLYVANAQPYNLAQEELTTGAGLRQIEDFAKDSQDEELLTQFHELLAVRKELYLSFSQIVSSADGLNYYNVDEQERLKSASGFMKRSKKSSEIGMKRLSGKPTRKKKAAAAKRPQKR